MVGARCAVQLTVTVSASREQWDPSLTVGMSGRMLCRPPPPAKVMSPDVRPGRGLMRSQVPGARSVTGADNYKHQSITFQSTCPTCGLSQAQRCSRAALQRLLATNYPIQGYCLGCDEWWSVRPREQAALARAVERMPTESTPTLLRWVARTIKHAGEVARMR